MAEIFDIKTRKKISNNNQENSEIDILYELGDEQSIIFSEGEILVTIQSEKIGSDSFWSMMCALLFLYEDTDELDDVRLKVLKKAIKKGIPLMTPTINFDFDTDK
tara:strand:+ start:3674 stop:3988 length:315 start_codon:yes stop_codon:yes gene_type:complete